MARPFRLGWVKATLRVMADSEKTPATLLDELAAWQARVVPRGSQQLTFEENG
jgi:hypothetical protein